MTAYAEAPSRLIFGQGKDFRRGADAAQRVKAKRDHFPRKAAPEFRRNKQRLIQRLAQTLHACRLICSSTDDRELEPLGHANVAVGHVAHVERQPIAKRRFPILRTFLVEHFYARLRILRCLQCCMTGRHRIAAPPANTVRGCPRWKDRQCDIADLAENFATVIEYLDGHAITTLDTDV